MSRNLSQATWRISEKTPWLYILWHLRHLVDKLASRTLQSILSENRYVHDAGDDQCAEIIAISIFISDRIEDRSTRRELEKKETLGSLPWRQNSVKENTGKNPQKMGRSWSSTHTYTSKYVFRRREEKSSYTVPFTLLYNIAIVVVVVVIIHARNARKSECGNNGRVGIHGVEETAEFAAFTSD